MRPASQYLGQFAKISMLKNHSLTDPSEETHFQFFPFHVWDLFTVLSGLEESQTWSIGPPKGHRKLWKFAFSVTSMTDLGTGMPSAPASGQRWPILASILLVVGRIFIQLKCVWKASLRYVGGHCKNSLFLFSSKLSLYCLSKVLVFLSFFVKIYYLRAARLS